MYKLPNDRILFAYLAVLTAVILVLSPWTQVEAQGIAVDNVSSAAVSNAKGLSFPHTVGSGSDRLLVVGTSFTTDCCGPLAPVDCTFHVNQSTPMGTFFSNRGTSSTASVSVTGVAEGELVIDTVGVFQGNPTIEAGQTPRWLDKDPDSNLSGAGSTESGPNGGGTVTMSWSVDNDWAIGAVAVKPAVVTAVKMRKFTAIAYGGGVFLRWHTSWEVNNLGWNVYREVDGQPVKITPGMLAGSVFLFGQGTQLTSGYSYSWWDPAGIRTDRYWIEDIDLNKIHTMHGPIVPQEADEKPFSISCSPLLSQLGKTTSYQNLMTCLRPKVGE